MFKTNSRKGLGLASIIALAASAFVGVTPAQAADVTVTPHSGTTYAAISGEAFSVSAVVGSGTTDADWALLKYEIKNAANATLSATISPALAGSAASQSNGVTASSVVLAGSTNSRTAHLQIQTSTTASDVVLTVQAWIDLNSNGVIDANEDKSAVQTINFFKAGNVTWTTTLTAPVLGDDELVATVTSDKNINLSQTAYAVEVGFATVSASLEYATVSGTATTVSSAGAFTQGDAGTLNTAKTSTEIEVSHTVLASNTYVAQAVYNGVEVGAESVGTVGAAAVNNIDAPTISKGVNVKGATIRTGTTDVTFTAIVSKSAGVAAANGTVVSVEISEGSANSLATGATVTAGGSVLSNSASATVQKITFNATVLDGKISVPVALSGLKAGNSFAIKASNGNADSSVTTVTITDTAAGSVADLTVLGDAGIVKAVKGGTFSLVFGALDNFDQPLAGDYRVTLTNAGSTATVSQALVSGKATFSVTDDGDKTEGTYTATLQMLSAASNTYVTTSLTDTVTPVIGASTAATKVTVTAASASNLVLNANAQTAADTRVGQTAPKVTAGNKATLSGQVTDANGLGTYAMVTLSAPNAMFEVDGVYSLGSVTVHTNANGAYAGVSVYRQLAGKVTVSATVGAVTGDVGLTYLDAAESSATAIELTAPASVKSGSTFQVKAKLTDAYGNPVKVSGAGILAVKYVGPGFVTATLQTTTDKDGEMMFSVLLGSADEGTATVTVAYDGDATASTTKDNVAKAATIAIGGAASAPATDQKLTVGSFKGFVAIYALNYTGQKLSAKVAGRWLVENNLSRFERVVRLTGAAIPIVVDLYIDGKFVRTENIVTK
jgi:hypothetical protein